MSISIFLHRDGYTPMQTTPSFAEYPLLCSCGPCNGLHPLAPTHLEFSPELDSLKCFGLLILCLHWKFWAVYTPGRILTELLCSVFVFQRFVCSFANSLTSPLLTHLDSNCTMARELQLLSILTTLFSSSIQGSTLPNWVIVTHVSSCGVSRLLCLMGQCTYVH
jgi:hypothetical protein